VLALRCTCILRFLFQAWSPAFPSSTPSFPSHPPLGRIPGQPQLVDLSCLAKELPELVFTQALGKAADEDLGREAGRQVAGKPVGSHSPLTETLPITAGAPLPRPCRSTQARSPLSREEAAA
jgi:hypothetical protein